MALSAGTADPEAVEEWSQSLPDSFLLCRDFGHNWRPYRAWLENGQYARVMRCPRCKTERHQWLDRRGAIESTYYAYPDGYQSPKGSGRMDGDGRAALRLVSTIRLIDKDA